MSPKTPSLFSSQDFAQITPKGWKRQFHVPLLYLLTWAFEQLLMCGFIVLSPPFQPNPQKTAKSDELAFGVWGVFGRSFIAIFYGHSACVHAIQYHHTYSSMVRCIVAIAIACDCNITESMCIPHVCGTTIHFLTYTCRRYRKSTDSSTCTRTWGSPWMHEDSVCLAFGFWKKESFIRFKCRNKTQKIVTRINTRKVSKGHRNSPDLTFLWRPKSFSAPIKQFNELTTPKLRLSARKLIWLMENLRAR